MAKRIKVGNKYYIVREKSTKKGKKGTIKGKWKPKKEKKTVSKELREWLGIE